MDIPDIINTKNGPPFNSEHFQRFCKFNGIDLKYSPLYHPSSNGLDEKSISTIKE